MNLLRIHGLGAAAIVQNSADHGVGLFTASVDERATGYAQALNLDSHLATHLAQLPYDVAPLPVTQVVEILFATHAAERASRQVTRLNIEVAPHVQVGDEVRGRVGKPPVRLVGLLLEIDGSLPRVLNGKRSHYHQNLRRATVV